MILLFINKIRLVYFHISEKNKICRKCLVGKYVLEKWAKFINGSITFSKMMKKVSRYVVV